MISPPPMRPELSLSDIFDPDNIYNPRPSFTPHGWLTSDPDTRAAYSGGALTVAGRMTTICADSVAGRAAQRLNALAGLESFPPILAYRGRQDYQLLLQQQVRDGRQLVFQHVHPAGELPDSLYAVPRPLLADLNDKARLEQFVPPEFVPQRAIIAPCELRDFAGTASAVPLVLKGGGPFPSGAGASVAIVRSAADWTEARSRLDIAEQIVVEEFLDIRDNFCLNFFSHGTASAFLGASRQITDHAGTYLGNWFDPADQPPPAALDVGHAIMQNAIARGYRGIAGFDMVVDRDGRLRVIDLNFRLNGSTPALMWGRSLWSSRPAARVMKSTARTFAAADHATLDTLDTLESLVRSGALFPLTLFESRDSRTGLGKLDLRALILGESAAAVRQVEDTLLRECQRPPATPRAAHSNAPQLAPRRAA